MRQIKVLEERADILNLLLEGSKTQANQLTANGRELCSTMRKIGLTDKQIAILLELPVRVILKAHM